ncbi:fatty acyl-AMP ligase [Sciscionella sediminilitoris]|uniref:fatty acyl-AMP ligase n=1 Tax=Sciscionella sediminilitoris TaxID=1445613 RepID=UPI0004DF6B5C|nr:fatty acyl-AMP ligase [Sciscionella sp. SE31]
MSRFVETLVRSAHTSAKGMVTGEPSTPTRSTWGEVHEQAKRTAGALRSGGLQAGDAVAVLAAEPVSIAPTVQGVWLAGGSVTMLHQPTQRTDLAEWANDTVTVLNMIGSKLVLLGAPFEAIADVLDQHGIRYVLLTELDAEPLAEPIPREEDDTALLQLTSGSTAEPKAVRITHGNLYANLTGMIERSGIDVATDVMMSWLPLFHDMGMVGFLTVPMTFGIELVKITPPDFLSGPLVWPRLMSKYRANVTAAPNFAYAIVGKRMASAEEEFDLSHLKIALNGAEPIDESAVAAFVAGGARFGMPAECVFPAYGMAECTLAISFDPAGTGFHVDHVDPDQLERDDRAVATEGGRGFPKLGHPLPGVEVSVVDSEGRVLGDREVGELRLRGSSVTPGYLTVRGPLRTHTEDGWLPTGDLGYTIDGQVVVCGRIKDVIIMGGRNIYPTDVERAATSVSGVRAGNAVAIRLDAGTKRERFAVAVESKLAGDSEEQERIGREVTARIMDAVGVRPMEVLVLGVGTLPKTPSGKLRRAAAADLLSA